MAGADAGNSENATDAPIVVKIGGARAVDPAGAIADIASLVADGERVVVVHGGSTAVDDTLGELGDEPEYVETPSGVVGRFTDERTLEVFEMVLPGKLNTELVAGLRGAGVDALGLSGVDGGLLTGPRKSAVRVVEDGKRKIRRGDHSGTIEQVNAGLLDTLIDDGYVPVVTVPMIADDPVRTAESEVSGGEGAERSGDEDGPRPGDEGAAQPVNADADRAAAAVAGALGGRLVLLTDVAGVYADPDDTETVIKAVETPDAWATLEDAAEGFMGRKVMAVAEALEGGAARAVIADANADAPVSAAVEGGGTHVLPEAVTDAD
jgi:acetylglutamate/LysW-gamma-L-alpha-aminoadipate kinase